MRNLQKIIQPAWVANRQKNGQPNGCPRVNREVKLI